MAVSTLAGDSPGTVICDCDQAMADGPRSVGPGVSKDHFEHLQSTLVKLLARSSAMYSDMARGVTRQATIPMAEMDLQVNAGRIQCKGD